jgi:hypothetical protein
VAAVARRIGPFVGLAGVAALARIPFMGSIGPDEGGYAYVAWRWAQGHALYHPTWIDRPQGLILVYRLLLSLASAVWTVRLGAVLAGVAITLLLVLAGRAVEAPAGLFAGALFATAGLVPHLEGFTFNGELAACVPATAAVAVAFHAQRRNSRGVLVGAAVIGGAAMLMKQSGFDGLVVVIAVAWLGADSPRDRAERLVITASAGAFPLAASAFAGWVSGWDAYWNGVVASHIDGADLATRASRFAASLPAAAHDLLPLMTVAALGAWRARHEPGPPRLALVWLAGAFVGVNVGGLYWLHYYVQLVPPLCLLGGFGLARVRDARVAWTAAAVVALPAVIFVATVAAAPDRRQDVLVKYALGFDNDERIARYVDAHSSSSTDVYALASRADFYFLAHRPAASPYLWGHPLREIPGALVSLERTLAGPRRPQLVVLFQRAPLHKHERLRDLVARYYHQVWRAPQTGTPVLAARRR